MKEEDKEATFPEQNLLHTAYEELHSLGPVWVRVLPHSLAPKIALAEQKGMLVTPKSGISQSMLLSKTQQRIQK